jgi:hypothetical protein
MSNKGRNDAKYYFIHGDEIRGLNIILGNVETESIGHISRVGPIELMKSS